MQVFDKRMSRASKGRGSNDEIDVRAGGGLKTVSRPSKIENLNVDTLNLRQNLKRNTQV